ncbi:uncharacterized protein [Spinacia oleracea]|uniref:CCHC-type domain-containing protein n=1 Tax=Spinacia oleracea TaxID=3562 RepID=A0ABM3RP75_SPIOL|nr:uncharacterized protein LOC110777813 [Spinacia oleracea]
MDMRDNVTSGHYFFDNKPMVVKPWTVDMDMEKEDLKSVPIWIQLRLNFKYCGEKSMFKIVSQLGTPIKRDSATVSRDKLQFARVLVDMPISKSLPDQISFMNEHNELIQVPVTYEWRPTVCTNCKQVGHLTSDCRHAKPKKIWVQKKQQPMIPQPAVIVPEPDVDQEGFQRTLRPIRVRPTSLAPVSVANHFQSLDEDAHSVCSTAGLDRGDDLEDVSTGRGNSSKSYGYNFGLLEHKVKLANLGKLYQRIFSNWCFTSNASYHKGGRIIVAWNPGSFSVNIQAVTSQLIHCFVQPVTGNSGFFCTFIYAFNDSHSRLELWKDLKTLNTQEPWILCGDFNCVMNMEERIGSIVRHTEIVDMCECMQHCEMEDIKTVGNFYTWNNKQQGASRVFSKLDRVMANPKWQSIYGSAEVCFMTEGCFDHSPGLLTVYPRNSGGKKPFKYFTMWKTASQFRSMIQTQWDSQVQGSKMYCVVHKLKRVKIALKELNKGGFNDIQAADFRAYNAMLEAQNAMHQHTDDISLADAELHAVQEYKIKHQAYVDFLRQKSKAVWIKDGDENTALFHQSIKARNSQNQVYSIFDMNGDWKDNPADVSQAFLDYYTTLLGTTHSNRKSVLSHVVQTGPLVTEAHKAILTAPYTADEVKEALFSIPGRKAPGPDGFGTYFYKDTWNIVGDEVTAAVLDILQHGKLLKELNHTVITLIPKTKCPKNVSEFRPISCCNTLYKCVTKVLCGRLRQVLPDLILENQGGFVHGRYIVHNIMVVQDLLKHYGRKGAKPGCMMKIDLQKAYDTVDWEFLQEMMNQLGFPGDFVDLVMECVTTPKFSLMLNGTMHGFFKSKRGLSSILDAKLLNSPICALLMISLCVSKHKSAIYCCGMPERDCARIVSVSGFTRSNLPFKYLGVPICSKRISAAQCDVLVDRMISRIKIWSSRNLSYTARVQLINSVLLSLHMYWAQIFILPKQVLQNVNKVCRAFLWSGQAYSNKPSNISWDRSCCDKKYGGLGFRDVFKWNIASMGKYVWAIASKQDNVWIKWINAVYVKDGDWWTFQPKASASWYWKRICATKEMLKLVYTQAEFVAITHYSVKGVYEKIIGVKPLIHWDCMVWNRLNIPKHRFICWLAVQERLQTTAKLARIGISNSATCLLCGQYDEEYSHLFFNCPYSSRCIMALKVWLNLSALSCTLIQLLRVTSHSRLTKFRKQVVYAALEAAVYFIWHSRNSSFWNASVPTVQHVVSKIKQSVKERILYVMPKKVSRKDSLWFMSL